MSKIDYTGDEVEFNEAVSQLYRMDRLQSEINTSFRNLTSKDEFGNYHYQNAFNNLTNLYLEISADLTPDEERQVLEKQKLIKEVIKKYPLFIKLSVDTYDGKKDKMIVNKPIYELFENDLQEYRVLINKLKKKHGYSNPLKEDSRFAMKM